MVNGLMDVVLRRKVDRNRWLIGVDGRAVSQLSRISFCKVSRLTLGINLGAYLTALAVEHADHGCLAVPARLVPVHAVCWHGRTNSHSTLAVHVLDLAAHEGLINLDRGALSATDFVPWFVSFAARRMRWSMCQADFCVTPTVRMISWLDTPFRQLATIHMAISHLSSETAESSKIVPTLMEN